MRLELTEWPDGETSDEHRRGEELAAQHAVQFLRPLQNPGLNRSNPVMCDYSLQHVASRPAKIGDKLVSSQFVNSITRGFAAVGEPNVAICLLPGTELVFDRDAECDHALGFFPNKKLRENVARFRQINLDSRTSRCTGISQRPSGSVDPPVRRPACHGNSVAGRCPIGRRREWGRGCSRDPTRHVNRIAKRIAKRGRLLCPSGRNAVNRRLIAQHATASEGSIASFECCDL